MLAVPISCSSVAGANCSDPHVGEGIFPANEARRPVNIAKFRDQLDRVSPEFLEVLEFLQSIASGQEQIVIRTSLTCDTVNPWGADNAELERDSSRMHEGKQF